MKRKDFFNTGALLGAAIVAPGMASAQNRPGSHALQVTEEEEGLWMDIPVFCSHEHWGSLFALGTFPGGFNADMEPGKLPPRRMGLADLLLDPYLGGSLQANGLNFREYPLEGSRTNLLDLSAKDPEKVFSILRKPLDEFRMKGTFQTLRLGIHYAYGYEIAEWDKDSLLELNHQVGEKYSDMFGWYREIMEKASLDRLCRPVHPEFYTGDFSTGPARKESTFTASLMRVDPLLEFWKQEDPRRDELAGYLGIDPVDGRSWKAFLEKLMILAEENGCIGIKQLQAYRRDLDFQVHDEKNIRFRGDLDKIEVKKFQDWMVHALCDLANEKNWPHQVHVGTHNHPHSNPLPLDRIARKYPKQKMVMLHCWPYVEETGFLAQSFPNVYIDSCWQPMLNPEFLKASLHKWLGYIPTNKITMSNDATSVEMAVGASLLSRKILKLVLPDLEATLGIKKQQHREVVRKLLWENAENIYTS